MPSALMVSKCSQLSATNHRAAPRREGQCSVHPELDSVDMYPQQGRSADFPLGLKSVCQ